MKHLLNYIKRWLLAHTEYDEKELNQLLAGGWDKVIIDIKMIFFFDSYYAPFFVICSDKNVNCFWSFF